MATAVLPYCCHPADWLQILLPSAFFGLLGIVLFVSVPAGVSAPPPTGERGSPQVARDQVLPPPKVVAPLNMALLSKGGAGTERNPWRGWDEVLNRSGSNIRAYFPTGHFLLQKQVNLKPGVALYGDGMALSYIDTPPQYQGNGLVLDAAINTNTPGYNNIADLTINGGRKAQHGLLIRVAHVCLDRVRTVNWKYHCTLDQACFVWLDGVHFIHQYPISGSRSLWLVNGGDVLRPGAVSELTNVIDVERCVFSGAAECFVVDDGGVSHWFHHNNFSDGNKIGYFANVKNLEFSHNYVESQSKIAEDPNPHHYPAKLALSAYCYDDDRAGGGVANATLDGNTFSVGAEVSLQAAACYSLQVTGCEFFNLPSKGANIVGAPGYTAGATTNLSCYGNNVSRGMKLCDDSPDKGPDVRFSGVKLPK